MCRKQKQHLAARAAPFGAECEILLGRSKALKLGARKKLELEENWERIQVVEVVTLRARSMLLLTTNRQPQTASTNKLPSQLFRRPIRTEVLTPAPDAERGTREAPLWKARHE